MVFGIYSLNESYKQLTSVMQTKVNNHCLREKFSFFNVLFILGRMILARPKVAGTLSSSIYLHGDSQKRSLHELSLQDRYYPLATVMFLTG